MDGTGMTRRGFVWGAAAATGWTATGWTATEGLALPSSRGPRPDHGPDPHLDHRGAEQVPASVDCPGWGARPPKRAVTVHNRRPVKIIVHHTATPNGPDLSRGAADSIARRIQNFHMDGRGWIDTGQHLTISRGGFLLEGRHRSLELLHAGRQQVEGAHCTGQNIVAIGIETEGTYVDLDPPPLAWDRLRETCAYICVRYGIRPTELYGHRDFANTACPGRMHGMLPRLRSEVAALMGLSLAESETVKATWPLLRRGDVGRRVRAAQHLLRAAGSTDLDPHGAYDRRTEDAVREYQTDQGPRQIRPDEVNGLLGAATWPRLVRRVVRGSAGTRAEREAERAVDVLAADRPDSVPAVVTTAVWQDLLGTGGSAIEDSTDPVPTSGR